MAEEWNCLTCEHSGDTGCWSTKPCDRGSEYTPIKKTNPVTHPAHYKQSCSLECIQVMEVAFGPEAVEHFCLGNAFKYLWRYKNKNGLEDLKKAEWYLNYIDKSCSIHCGDQFETLSNLLDELMEGEKDDSE